MIGDVNHRRIYYQIYKAYSMGDPSILDMVCDMYHLINQGIPVVRVVNVDVKEPLDGRKLVIDLTINI